jgi:hypothetical protein
VELAQPEAGFDVDDQGVVSGSLELQLDSACCSDPVATAYLDVELDTGLQHKDGCKEPNVLLDSESAEPTDWYQAKDRHGKPIKSMRYQKHFYGADISVQVRCESCGAETSGDEQVGEQASYFEQY